MSDTLKPCPFCGKPPRSEPEHSLTRDFWRISCIQHPCPATLIVSCDTEAETIKAWNRRAPSSPEKGETPPVGDQITALLDAFEVAVSNLAYYPPTGSEDRADDLMGEIVSARAPLRAYVASLTSERGAALADAERWRALCRAVDAEPLGWPISIERHPIAVVNNAPERTYRIESLYALPAKRIGDGATLGEAFGAFAAARTWMQCDGCGMVATVRSVGGPQLGEEHQYCPRPTGFYRLADSPSTGGTTDGN